MDDGLQVLVAEGKDVEEEDVARESSPDRDDGQLAAFAAELVAFAVDEQMRRGTEYLESGVNCLSARAPRHWEK